jgi:MFS family permease
MPAPDPEGGAVQPDIRTRSAPAALFAMPDFRRLWIASGLVSTMRWLEMLTISIFVFQLTSSALQVALILFLRMLPSLLFGALAGAVADRFNRKAMLIVGLGAMSAISTLLGLLVSVGAIAVWHIALGIFLNGIYWAGDFAVRRTVIGDIVGIERFGVAMSLDSITLNATRMAGPLIGGALLETAGMDGVYYLGGAFYLSAALLVARVRYRPAATRQPEWKVLTNIGEGLRFIRGQRAIVGVLAITVVANLFGFPYATMLPVIGKEVLELSPTLTGILASAEGMGSLIGAVAIAYLARPHHYMRLYLNGTALFMAGVLVFSLSQAYPLSFLALLLGGFGFAGFASMQPTLVMMLTPPALRPRVMGVLSVMVGTGPIGILHVGILARWLGADTAVSVMATEGLLALAACAVLWPELRRPMPDG